MNILDWFKAHIGKSIVVASPEKTTMGSFKVKNEAHAVHLHNLQSSGYRYRVHNEDDDSISPVIDAVLIADALSDMGSDDANYTPTASDDTILVEFGGGGSDGGGASASWDNGSDN